MKWWYYIIFYLVSQLVAGLAGALLTTLLHLDSTIVMVVSLVLAQLLAIGLVLVFKPAWLHAADDRNRLTVLALLMALPIIVLVNLMMEILPEAPNILDESFSQIIYNPIGMLTIAVLGPVSEELLFRAGVLGGLLKRDAERNAERSTFNVQRSMFNVQRSTFNVQRSTFNVRPWRAIMWSALLFSVAHLNPAQMPVAFLLGILLGWAYWRTGSLVAPCLIHILNNGLAVVLAWIYNSPDVTLSQVLGSEVGVAVAVGVSVVWLGLCWHRIAQA